MSKAQYQFAFIAGLALVATGSVALAADPANMMARCRNEAARTLHVRLPNVETKYEGQRVDGTHAVNGTAFVRKRTRTFQCNFNKPGRRITKFVVNP